VKRAISRYIEAAALKAANGGEAPVHHYYLATAEATGTDTIYVVNETDCDSAAHLVQRLGCGRITREQALQAIEDCGDAKLENIAFRGGLDAERVSDEEVAAMNAGERAEVARALRLPRRTGQRHRPPRGSVDLTPPTSSPAPREG
jgi:hypothetical protein